MRQHSTPAIFFSCLVAAAGCPAPAPAPGPLAPLPVVQGLVPALDEDPADHSVRFRIVAREGIIELVDGTQTLGLTYNGMSPGPLLQAHLGDTVTIEVENQLLEPTTIHWHGLRIDDAMDGVAHGEVAPIPPGETFTYTFVPPEAGTFWYHPHLNTAVQIEAGLYGMLVVHEPEETRPSVNAERGFILDDIRLDDDGQIAPHQSAGPDIMHGRLGETLLVNGSASMPVVKLGPGQVERWRIVSAASSWTTLLRFEGLEVRQVGADGGLWPQNECKPVTQVEIPVGARAELEVRLADGATTARVDNIMLALDENNNVVEDPRLAVKVEIDATLAVAEPLEGHTADPQYQHLTDDGAVEKTIEI